MALNALPSEWQDWIVENLNRSCEATEMAQIMARDGQFDLNLIRAAIEEAIEVRTSSSQLAQTLPEIDASANSIFAGDRTIDVLLTLAAPRIVLLGNVLSGDECDELTSYCERRLVRSPVVDDADGSTKLHPHRTSRGTMIERGETKLVSRIETRLAALARWPVDHGEGLQIQQYEATNEYRPHFDWFDSELPGPRKHMEHGGQRVATFVLYLSDVESGGGTSFPSIGLEALPRKGGAVFFQNTNRRLVPDRRTLHAGSPVVRGVKTIANKWLRERTY